MSLEPRLLEYLQRRSFFKKNDMDAQLLEKQYMITQQDKRLINMFLNKKPAQKKDLEQDMFTDYIEMPKEKKELTGDSFRNDERFQRLRRKIENEKIANGTRGDISELSRNYDLFSDSGFASMSGNMNSDGDLFNGYDTNINRRRLQQNSINEDNCEEQDYFAQAFPHTQQNRMLQNSRQQHLRQMQQTQQIRNREERELNQTYRTTHPGENYKYQSTRQNHTTPKIQYEQRVYNDNHDSFMHHQPTLDNIVGDIGNYKNKINNTYNFNSDEQYGGIIINKNEDKQSDYNRMYGKIPEMTGGDLRNIDIETYIKFGSPTSKARSLGFENPVEHHFSYIDSDIQNPNHVVNDRPELTRLSNKQTVNYKGRKIY